MDVIASVSPPKPNREYAPSSLRLAVQLAVYPPYAPTHDHDTDHHAPGNAGAAGDGDPAEQNAPEYCVSVYRYDLALFQHTPVTGVFALL